MVEACLGHLRRLPFVRRASLIEPTQVQRKLPLPIDAVLSITTPSGTLKLLCQIKRTHLRSEGAQLLLHTAAKARALIILAPFVGRELGQQLEEARINFIDAAGNCHVRIGNHFLARVQGRTALTKTTADRAWRAPAHRVLFALLAQPTMIDATARVLGSAAGVSPQTASDVRYRLVELGLLLHTKKRTAWAPNRIQDAQSLWLSGFTATLAPSLLIGRFRARETDPNELENRIESQLDTLCNWRYGGSAACMRLTGFYRGTRTVIYAFDPPANMPSQLQLVRDSKGPVVLMHAPGSPAFESMDQRCVHPLLAYADLLSDPDSRAKEGAREIYERYIQPSEPTR